MLAKLQILKGDQFLDHFRLLLFLGRSRGHALVLFISLLSVSLSFRLLLGRLGFGYIYNRYLCGLGATPSCLAGTESAHSLSIIMFVVGVLVCCVAIAGLRRGGRTRCRGRNRERVPLFGHILGERLSRDRLSTVLLRLLHVCKFN